MSRARRWCATLNNYTSEEYEVLKSLSGANYIVVGKEKGESGTPHLQIYIEFTNAIRLVTLKKKLPRAHIEQCKGTAQQNIDYCKKENNYEEVGEPHQQGKRNDLLSLKQSIDDGESKYECFQTHTETMGRYRHFYHDYKSAAAEQMSKARTEPPEIRVLVGKAGSGKTRQIYDNHDIEDIYVVNHGDGNGGIWFDGYYGQKVVLFDDFYGWVRYDLMLRLLDRYPLQVQTKGGHTWWCPTIIYITSNSTPDTWYPNVVNKDALERRVAGQYYPATSVTETSVTE